MPANAHSTPAKVALGFLAGLVLVSHAAEGSPPQANLAGYGRIRLLDLADPARATTAESLATGTGKAPVRLSADKVLELEWDQPRPVQGLRLDCSVPLTQAAVRVQWWRRIWPDNGTGGWMKLDDPFNGTWTDAKTMARLDGSSLALEFAPLEAAEAPGIENRGARHRLTYKLRLVPADAVEVRHVAVFSDAVLRTARIRFEWGARTTVTGTWAPRFEVRNGQLLGTRQVGTSAAVVEVEYADAPDRLSPDRGHVAFRSGEARSFAVFVDDVLRDGGLLVKDLGVFVSDADKNLTFANWAGPAGDVWAEGTVAEQVARRAEQSFAQVSQALPQKPPPYLWLGVPSLRQEIALLPQGQIELRADSLRSPGPDAAQRPWPDERLVYDFGSGEHPVMGPRTEPAVTRTLEDGWLPVVRHAWRTDGLEYTETCVAAPLLTSFMEWEDPAGTEPVVLGARFEMRNPTSERRPAWLWLELSRSDPLRLAVDGTFILERPSDRRQRPGYLPVRGRFDRHGKGMLDLGVLAPARAGSYHPGREKTHGAREAVRYRVDLEPGESQVLDFFVPYVELLDAREAAALKGLSFTNLHDAAVRFWRERVERGMTYDVPDQYLNELFRANLWHVLISTDRDPVTGHYQHGAATHQYPNFLNETAMVVRSLEMRGEHREALRLLEPFVACQGVKGLPGNFRSREGVLYAAHPTEPDPYTAQGYNMHHGWGLWALSEHYFWTRDANYLLAMAPQLVQAADWVTRERQATRIAAADGSRRVEFGLLPAGDLEDVEEYLYFYATDAYHHLGMKTLAEALEALCAAMAPARGKRAASGERPAGVDWDQVAQVAARLARETREFGEDIRSSVAESVATSPVVRLRDGRYAPFVPARAYALTHLKEGWIREALYPALHLVNGGVYGARHPFVDWMIQDLEDNVFLSAESGYEVTDPRANFFHQGGFALQPNLLDLALVYLERDQVPNFLRAFYNTAWASLHPDAMCFAEWVPKPGQAGGPLYKTPDECKFIQWMRQMLIVERGDALELGLGVPQAWMRDGQRVRVGRAATHFGVLDLEIVSHSAQNTATATIALTPTAKPAAVRLRLRHSDGKPLRAAQVNDRPARVDAGRQLIELPTAATHWQVRAMF